MEPPVDSPADGVKLAAWELADQATDCRLKLLSAGFTPLPVMGKIPAFAGWQNGTPDTNEIKQWTKGAPTAFGTGITTAFTPALDIDVLHEEAAVAVEELTRERFEGRGVILTRIGRAPKRVILFRTDKRFDKIAINLIAPDGDNHKLEFLGSGQQVVVNGRHPDTGKPYSWHGGEPGRVARQDLPYITGTEARQLIDDAADLLVSEFGYQRASKSNGRHSTRAAGRQNGNKPNAGIRERKYAKAALDGCACELARTPEGGRNDALNRKAFRLGTMVASGWISRDTVIAGLLSGARDCGLSEIEARRTLESGLSAGGKEPHPDLDSCAQGKASAAELLGNLPDTGAGSPALHDARHGKLMLAAVHKFLGRFVSYPSEHARVAHALWCIHAHLMHLWDTTPRLAFLSPEPASGKSRALEVTELVVPNAVMAVNVSPAYLFRKVADENGPPTILFDEIDTVFGPKAKENEEIRGLLNAGHRKGAVAGRCVVHGKAVCTEEIPAYAAVALAGLGWLPDTVMSRAVIVPMRRRHAGERIESFRRRIHVAQGNEVRRLIEAWVQLQPSEIVWPELPPGVEDRDADVWEPLVAVADMVGGEWPALARAAAVALVAASKEAEPSLGIRLLADTRIAFGSTDQMTTLALLNALREMPEAPWNDLKGRPLDERRLAARLRPYGIKPRVLRVGDATPRGYRRDDFLDAWQRYFSPPPAPDKSATSATSATTHQNPRGFVADDVADSRPKNPNKISDVADVAVVALPATDRAQECAQCNGAHDGKEKPHLIHGRTVWLHPECTRFWPVAGLEQR